MEFTLLQIEEQMMVSKPYQHHMTTMFGLFLGVDEDIINVHKHKTMEVLPKHLIHESLEYERSFGQAIQHGPRFIVAHVCDEGGSQCEGSH